MDRGMIAWLRLAALRMKARGLLRERMRLHQYRAGIEYALRVNADDRVQVERDIAAALDAQRQARFATAYRVRP